MTPPINFNSTDFAIMMGLSWVALVSLALVIVVYGFLTPWWRSRTGIGFMSTKVAFFVAVALSVARYHNHVFPLWVYYGAWVLIILTINLGITWNIIYKQFVQHRGDEVADKSHGHVKQEGIAHDVLTGEIPIQKVGDRSDRGISGKT